MAERTHLWRSLDRIPVRSLAEYLEVGGGTAVESCREVAASVLIDAVADAAFADVVAPAFRRG